MMTIYIQLVEMELVGAVGHSILPFTFIDNFLCRILILCISRPALGRWNPLRRLQKYLEIMPDLSDFLRDLTIKHSVYQLVCLSYSCSINCKKISGLYSVNCNNISGNGCENLPISACCDSFILWYHAYQRLVLKQKICFLFRMVSPCTQHRLL